MALPHFLIIGAMKAGTTTLYRDLLTNPAVFMPGQKEPHNLCDDAVLTDSGRAAYADLFAAARRGQICGEASTGYSKLPDRPGVPDRALRVLGPDLRVIYLVREPVARIISHHYHSYVSGLFGPDIDQVVKEDSRLLNYSRYAMQIRPWLDTFGNDRVLILKFESFIAARAVTIATVSEFLGVEPRPELVKEDAVYNRSDGKPVLAGIWRHIAQSRFYRRLLRPYLPHGSKDMLRTAILPKSPSRPDPPSAHIIRLIHQALAADHKELQTIMGCGEPLWPHAASCRNHAFH